MTVHTEQRIRPVYFIGYGKLVGKLVVIFFRSCTYVCSVVKSYCPEILASLDST